MYQSHVYKIYEQTLAYAPSPSLADISYPLVQSALSSEAVKLTRSETLGIVNL